MADYRAYKEAYFGKIKYVPKGIKTPYDMFLFFVQAQKSMKREKLLENLKMPEERAHGMSDKNLLLEYCERGVSGSGLFKTVDGVLTHEANLTPMMQRMEINYLKLKEKHRLAGAAGFEPAHGGIKSRCLTAWLRPIGPVRARSITCAP